MSRATRVRNARHQAEDRFATRRITQLKIAETLRQKENRMNEAKYKHQPDFASASIVSRPGNNQPNNPLVIDAPCICSFVNHHWSATIYEGSWKANMRISETEGNECTEF